MSDDNLKPRDATDVEEAIRWALAGGKTLEVVGRGSKRAIGRAAQWDATLDLSALTGVTLYEPEELVLSAKAGTPLAEVEALAAASSQELAFEPMDYGPLLGGAVDAGTIGGTLAANLSGPRRIKAGAARDHFLGVSAVSGRGETFKSGGRVVKNVTGYDLCKLLAGSWGTLAAMTDVTVKTLPRAESEETVLVMDLDDAAAGKVMAAVMGSFADVSAAAHLPAAAAARITETASAHRASRRSASKASRHRLRIARACWRGLWRLSARSTRSVQRLRGRFGVRCATSRHSRRSATPAQPLGIGLPLARGRTVRLAHLDGAVPRRRGRAHARREEPAPRSCTIGPAASSGRRCRFRRRDAPLVRASVAAAGGHATLVRAPAALRAKVDVFEPEPAVLAALTARVREGFDPRGVLNPGRMWAGV